MPSEPRPTVESLLEHTGFVRGLARRALGTDDQSDDVSQEAWLAALEHGPREGAAARSWLHRVIRNKVISIRRKDSTRQRHLDTLARDEAHVPSPDEILVREESRARLVRILVTLDPIYREPLVLKYYEDLPPRKIAARLGLPVETVRTRIKRGIEQIRGRLDAEYGDRRAWVLALIPLSRLPPSSPLSPAPASPTGTSSASTGAGVGAAALVGSAAVVVLATGALLFGALRSSDPPNTHRPAESALSPRPRDPMTRESRQPVEPTEVEQASVAAAPSRDVYAIVVKDYAGELVPGAGVRILQRRRGHGVGQEAIAGHTDEQGRLEVPRVAYAPGEPRAFSVHVTQPLARSDLQTREIAEWMPGDTTVRLARGFVVDGEVIDHGGRGVPGALVELVSASRSERVETDAFGRFVARGLPPGRWNTSVVLRTMDGERRTRSWVLDGGTRGARLEVEAGLALLVQIPKFDAARHAHLDLRMTQLAPFIDQEARACNHRVSSDGTVWIYGLDEFDVYALWWQDSQEQEFAHAPAVAATDGVHTLHLRKGRQLQVDVEQPSDLVSWPVVVATAPGIEMLARWDTVRELYVVDGLPSIEFDVVARARDEQGRELVGEGRMTPGTRSTLRLDVR